MCSESISLVFSFSEVAVGRMIIDRMLNVFPSKALSGPTCLLTVAVDQSTCFLFSVVIDKDKGTRCIMQESNKKDMIHRQ
jgi:hypothetical protein